MDKHFSEMIQTVLKTFKLQEAELAALLGVHEKTIRRWIRGYKMNYTRKSMIVFKIRQLIRDKRINLRKQVTHKMNRI
ncbi:plasmid maintenance system antidote protein VapI [Metabacillus niabensis]|uniref:Plasmid maintenance system antidote protein VapI n=1 Tax=Metabacillus niabensis TaxID=324854 RepID=A0ABT9Z0T9_9BACI|nr:plasmid maintenance system antidote protein VapI [Metabacillus niabensis]